MRHRRWSPRSYTHVKPLKDSPIKERGYRKVEGIGDDRRRIVEKLPFLPEDDQRYRVRCGGKLHTILYKTGGDLVLVDHQHEAQERLLAQMASKPCRCLDVLDAWRASGINPYWIAAHLPRRLHNQFVRTVDRHIERGRGGKTEGSLDHPQLADKAMERLVIDTLKRVFAGTERAHKRIDSHISVSALGSPYWPSVTVWETPQVVQAYGNLGKYWWKAHREGRSIIDGRFTLGVFYPDDSGFLKRVFQHSRDMENGMRCMEAIDAREPFYLVTNMEMVSVLQLDIDGAILREFEVTRS